jgi:CheY-like chemotaxis protein
MYKDMISRVFTSYKSDNDIYHDLMQSRVREILLVATIYDAFILEQEGKLTELIFGEYYRLNLSTAPRVTSVAFGEEALELLKSHRFDMVILTMRIDEMTPFELCGKIREIDDSIPVMLLLSDDRDLELIEDRYEDKKLFDKIFTWNGDAKVLLAMIKYVEDRINVVIDTRIGLVRVILLVEDSIHYYSRYLPVLNSEIMKQTQRLIADENLDEIKKLLRMRTRPKVLMVSNYEDAIEILEKYRDYLLCVISDVKFPREGKLDERAGIRLVKLVRERMGSLPILLQSSNPENARVAEELGVSFLDKNSPNLPHDLTSFIFRKLGFGGFVFRDSKGNEIASAESMSQFRKLLHTVPDESLVYHAKRNHFSSWLMARGEIQIAKYIQPIKVSDFDSYGDLREHLIEVCDIVHQHKTRGKVVNFDHSVQPDEETLVQLSPGSVGGKGRGMVFLNMLMENRELFDIHPEVNVLIPRTAIIGTEEYDYFMRENHFRDSLDLEDPEQLKERFLKASLSDGLREKLLRYLRNIRYPLAVRSSSLFEDSKSQPFSGIYETYFLPNSHQDTEVRFSQLERTIKLIFASVYSDSARSYLEAVNYKIGEEKMAVLIQEVVGKRFSNRLYPHISGLAQSLNYYPVSYMKPEDGVGIIGMGLGNYVVDGGKSWRFCPRYPEVDYITPEQSLKETQTEFYALNLESDDFDLAAGSDVTLLRLGVPEAEKDGSINYCASVLDADSGAIMAGSHYKGPKILNFASILKYNSFPLAEILESVLEIIKSSMGIPVQIEFAVDLSEDGEGNSRFYILQIKPLLGDIEEYQLDLDSIDREMMILYSEHTMGNGVIRNLRDVIYADGDGFDRNDTLRMKKELRELNARMREEGRGYMLIGPGRWGSRDRFMGVPVRWADISNARVVVEVELDDFRFDASLGSHFFHNITSKGVGYFSVSRAQRSSFIDWDWLKDQHPVEKTEHFVHLQVDRPMIVKMDGRRGISVIQKPVLRESSSRDR